MHKSQNGRPVGRVVGLWRYPVKSMGAEALSFVDVSWHGFAGDRRWAFIRSDVPQSGFPWLTLRERADMSPVSLITTQSIARLGEMVGCSLDVQRFRPNILVQTGDATPFVEDSWVGAILRIGGLTMRVDKRDGRCAVITIDPTTTERNPAILRAVAQNRQGCLGIYGSTVEPGRVALDDKGIH